MRRLNMQDTMRNTCLTDLAGIWYNLIATYGESNPSFAKAWIGTVKFKQFRSLTCV